jgi:hypothetical protein
VCFGRAFVRLRRRGRHDHAGWDRAALFAGGMTLAVIPLVSPLAGSSLSGHMMMAEQLLTLGACGALLVRSCLRTTRLRAALARAAV